MQPVISDVDHNELGKLLVKQKNQQIKIFKVFLQRLKILKEKDIPKNTVRLNSVVVFWNSLLKKIVKLRIVVPEKEDLKAMQVSVLSPISMALLGHKEKDTLTMCVPGVEKRLRILRVSNN